MGIAHQSEHVISILSLYVTDAVSISPDVFVHVFSLADGIYAGLKRIDDDPANGDEIQ
jgi:hypothetical protein